MQSTFHFENGQIAFLIENGKKKKKRAAEQKKNKASIASVKAVSISI